MLSLWTIFLFFLDHGAHSAWVSSLHKKREKFQKREFLWQKHFFSPWLPVCPLIMTLLVKFFHTSALYCTSDCNVVGCMLNICFQQFEGNSVGIKNVIIPLVFLANHLSKCHNCRIMSWHNWLAALIHILYALYFLPCLCPSPTSLSYH